MSEVESRREAFGLPVLFGAESIAAKAVADRLADARDFRAVRLPDLAFKASIAMAELGGDPERAVAQAISEAGTWAEELALSLVRDLTRLAAEA